MSIDPDKVKRIMEALERIYAECATDQQLSTVLGRVAISDFDHELAYCQEKGWAKRKAKIERWCATAKGVDAHMKMKKGKNCFEIGDP